MLANRGVCQSGTQEGNIHVTLYICEIYPLEQAQKGGSAAGMKRVVSPETLRKAAS